MGQLFSDPPFLDASVPECIPCFAHKWENGISWGQQRHPDRGESCVGRIPVEDEAHRDHVSAKEISVYRKIYQYWLMVKGGRSIDVWRKHYRGIFAEEVFTLKKGVRHATLLIAPDPESQVFYPQKTRLVRFTALPYGAFYSVQAPRLLSCGRHQRKKELGTMPRRLLGCSRPLAGVVIGRAGQTSQGQPSVREWSAQPVPLFEKVIPLPLGRPRRPLSL